MDYRELRKYYYGPTEEYMAEYSIRYNSKSTIHVNFEIAGHKAFFEQNEPVLKSIMRILRTDKHVATLIAVLPGAALNQYSRKCLIDEIVITNGIEGVRSTRREIDDALDELEKQSTEKDKTKRFLGMVNRYQMLRDSDEIPLSTCEDIRKLYDSVVLDEVVSEDPKNAPDGKLFRKEIATVKSSTDRELHRGAYPETKIIEELNKALAFLNDKEIENLYRICIFHYLLEYIHPFYDGNGRLGRFIVSYKLSKTLEPLMAYRLSETIHEGINDYYKAFNTCNDSHSLGDMTPFLLMMLDMINKAEEELKAALLRKTISWKKYQPVLPNLIYAQEKKMLPLYDLFVQAALFSEIGISRADICNTLDLSNPTLSRMLKKAEMSGIVITKKKKRAYYYSADLAKLDRLLEDDVRKEF